MGKWEIQMLMLRKVNTRGFQVLNLPQKPIRNTCSVPILQVGRLRWGMVGPDWGSVSEQPLEENALNAVDAELGAWDSTSAQGRTERERERHQQGWGFQETTIPSAAIKQQLTTGQAGKMVPAIVSSQLCQAAQSFLTICFWAMVIVAPWNFINDILESP